MSTKTYFMTEVTSFRQSQELVKAGLNPATADLFYGEYAEDVGSGATRGVVRSSCLSLVKPSEIPTSGGKPIAKDHPCWSFGRLFGMLPNPWVKKEAKYYPIFEGVGGRYCLRFVSDSDACLCEFSNRDLMRLIVDCFKFVCADEELDFVEKL